MSQRRGRATTFTLLSSLALSITACLAPSYAVAEVPLATFVGTPGTLYVTPRLRSLFTTPDHICSLFVIRAVGNPISGGVLTSTGLGRATFAVVAGNAALDCSQTHTQEALYLDLPFIDRKGITIRISIPRQSFPANGGQIDGRLRLTVPPKLAIETTLRLDGGFLPWKLASSVLALLIPAAVTAYAGYRLFTLQKRWESRQAAADQFADWMESHWTDLSIFFRDYLPNLNTSIKNDAEWATQLEADLVTKCGLNQAPTRLRQQFRRALASGSRSDGLAALARVFPDWGPIIKESRK